MPATKAIKAINKTAVLAIVLTAYTMIVLDISIVITALPEIHRTLGFSATALSWVQNAYLLAFGGLLLLGARAGDLFGRRRVFIIGLGVFTLALAPLTAGGLAGVAAEDAGAAGGVTNVAHQIGGSLGPRAQQLTGTTSPAATSGAVHP